MLDAFAVLQKTADLMLHRPVNVVTAPTSGAPRRRHDFCLHSAATTLGA